jgi:hypothetical protein
MRRWQQGAAVTRELTSTARLSLLHHPSFALGWRNDVNKGKLGGFSSACQLKSHGRIESRKRSVACGRCQSAGAARVSSGCGVGRAGTHRYRGIDIPARPVMGGGVRKTTSGVLNTVSPSQLRPGMVKRCENGEIGIFSLCLPVDISSVTGRCQHCWSHAKAKTQSQDKMFSFPAFHLAPSRFA